MSFIPEAVREEFDIPGRIEPAALPVMGYPAKDAGPSPGHSEKKPMQELVFYQQF